MAEAIDTLTFTYEEVLAQATRALQRCFEQEIVAPEHRQYFLFGYITSLTRSDLTRAMAEIDSSDFPSQHTFWIGYQLGEACYNKSVNQQQQSQL